MALSDFKGKKKMIHELKIWPQYFQAVADGSKTFEIRENDRGFQKGDIVILKEWDPTEVIEDELSPGGILLGSYTKTVGYTGRYMEFVIGYVLAIDKNTVVFSLLKNRDPRRND